MRSRPTERFADRAIGADHHCEKAPEFGRAIPSACNALKSLDSDSNAAAKPLGRGMTSDGRDRTRRGLTRLRQSPKLTAAAKA
jgi:hypothetical protein